MTKEEACKVISANKKEMDRLLKECVDASNKSGVPFSVRMPGIYNTYCPENAVGTPNPQYPDDEEYFDENGNELHIEYPENGWQESMC